MMKSIQVIVFWLFIIIALILLVSAITFGGDIPISKQLPILSLLITISSIVFGLMGVWLAVIYSDSLKTIFDNDLKAVDKKDSIKNFRYLSKPMMVSAIIISYVLLFYFLHPLLNTISMINEYYSLLRKLSFIILCFLMLAQIWTIIYIFAPAENIKNKAEHHINKQDRHEELTKNTKSVKRQ